MNKMPHHLAAVWFADIVGYSALSEEDEAKALRVVQAFMATTRDVVERYGGRVVKFLGDGALAEFPSTDLAVRSAKSLVRRFPEASDAAGLGRRTLRVGVHVGDVAATEDGDLFGDGVNVASRIQAEADPDSVWVSEDVRRQLRQRREFAFEPRGERAMKGIRRPLPLFTVEVEEDEAEESVRPAKRAGPPRWARNLPRSARVGLAAAVVLLVALGVALLTGILPWGSGTLEASDASVAVLPFDDMSEGGGQEYFADGMTEEILNALARVPDLRVAARTSSFAYKGREVDIRDVARELGVATVLEGSVRRDGDDLRITAQLIDARNGFHLWSETYDRKLESVFAIQEEIAAAIARELKGSLGLSSGDRLVRNRTGDMGAYELYLDARSHVRRRGEGVEQAIGLFERALQRDPGFAPAWAGLAEAWSLVPYWHAGRDSAYWAESLDRAAEAAEKALELDPDLVSAHVALGNAHRDRWEWAESDRVYQRALELAPDDPEANQQYAEMLAGMGRTEEAIPYARRAAELDPLAAVRLSALGYILWNADRPDEALASLRRALAIDSTLGYVNGNIGRILISTGRYAEAEAFLQETGVPVDAPTRRVTRALAAADTAAAIEILRADTLVAGYHYLYALVGDPERAIAALAKGVFGGPFGTPDALWDPTHVRYRDDPRFRELVRSRNLAPR
jgi:adenylate cyclase